LNYDWRTHIIRTTHVGTQCRVERSKTNWKWSRLSLHHKAATDLCRLCDLMMMMMMI